MSKAILSTLIVALWLLAGCEKDNPYEDFTQEQLSKSVSEKYRAILNLAQPTSCTDPAEWHIAEIETVCGRSHLAYHETVDKRKLTALIKDYNLLIEVYRPMVAPLIYCLAYREPKGVVCEDGRPLVEFDQEFSGVVVVAEGDKITS